MMDWNTIRRTVYRRDDYTCQRCGAKGGTEGDKKIAAHHIVPRSEGGPDEVENLITLCDSCHARSHPENSKLAPSANEDASEIADTSRERYNDYDLLVPIHVTGNQYAVIENRSTGSSTINVFQVNLGDVHCDCPQELGEHEVCKHFVKSVQMHPVNIYGNRDWALHHMITLEGECWSPVCITDILEVTSDLEPNTAIINQYLDRFSPEI